MKSNLYLLWFSYTQRLWEKRRVHCLSEWFMIPSHTAEVWRSNSYNVLIWILIAVWLYFTWRQTLLPFLFFNHWHHWLHCTLSFKYLWKKKLPPIWKKEHVQHLHPVGTVLMETPKCQKHWLSPCKMTSISVTINGLQSVGINLQPVVSASTCTFS